jgi:hypothetical protein
LRVLGGVDFRGSIEFSGFKLFLLFSWFCHFSCLLLAFAVFLVLDDLLSFLLAFGLLAVPHGILDSNFKLCAFCCQ